MNEDKTINNKILGLFTFIILLFVSFVCFIFIGIAKVDAKSYTFTTTPAIRFTTGQTANTGTVKTCQNTIECWYSTNGDNVTNYVQYQYGVNRSNNSTDSHYEQETYILSFRARIVSLDTLNKNNLIFRLYYYPNSSNEYGRAYCDGGESYKITYNNNSDNDVYVDYNCNEFAITSNVQYLVISIGATPNTIFGTQVSQNLKLIGPGDATNKDVINSIDNSTSTIIENNNTNTDKITQSQDKTTNAVKENTNTNKSILDTIKSFFGGFFSNLVNSIVGIFLPDDFDFLNGFLDTLENKLGFIASVPIQILEFLIDLVTYDFDDMTSITLPEFSVLNYDLWESQEIDLTEIINTFEPYRIYTNIACVSLCAYYLMKLYENFASGGGN